MNRDELMRLAERVEQASGPDRELDLAVAQAAGGYILERRGKDRQEWLYPVSGKGIRRSPSPYSGGFDGLPRYTASLDAAMSLVPEGMVAVAANSGMTKLPEADFTRASAIVGRPHDTAVDSGIEAANPALALTAAALRALSQSTGRGMDDAE